jgi:hypothetical protein
MLGKHLISMNSAVQKHAVPSGIAFCQPPRSDRHSVQVPARIVPKAPANLVLAPLKAHWDVLAAIDFTAVEVWTKGGLVTFYLLFVMEIATRRVHLAACSPSLGDDFMKQIARNLTDPFDGFLKDTKYVLMDRDSNFSCAFRTVLEEAEVEPV